jgi:hypothetical protein
MGKFGAQGKNGVCILIHSLACLRQYQATAHSVEKRRPDRFLQQLELTADGLRGDVQNLRCPGNTAFARHGVEIEQMVVVEVPHVCG